MIMSLVFIFNFFRLQGNPLCLNSSLSHFCGFEPGDENSSQSSTNTTSVCLAQECEPPFEYSNSSTAPVECFCAAPLFVGYRLKSPGFLDFRPFIHKFEEYLTSGLQLFLYQLSIESFAWENGHRLGMELKLFPVYDASSAIKFNMSEVRRIFGMFTSWNISDNDLFGPYELISFPLMGFYKDGLSRNPSLICFTTKLSCSWWIPISSIDKASCHQIRDLGFKPRLYQKPISVLT